MTDKEYAKRLLEIRVKVNELIDDLGVTYDTQREMLERVLNAAMNGDLTDIKDGKVKTHKVIFVSDFHSVQAHKEKRFYI